MKKLLFSVLALAVILTPGFLFLNSFSSFFEAHHLKVFVHAEEDDEDDEDEDDEEKSSSSASSSGSVSAKTSVDVSTDTQVVTLKDSDGDGLLDGSDPHPSVAEIYIVSDDNRNGIVDAFE